MVEVYDVYGLGGIVSILEMCTKIYFSTQPLLLFAMGALSTSFWALRLAHSISHRVMAKSKSTALAS